MLLRLLPIALCLAARGASAAEALTFSHEEPQGRITIAAGNEPVATYVYRDPVITRPHLCDLYAPGSVRVSRNHPPQRGVDPDDHATMHPGAWLAFGSLSGADFWRNAAPVEFVRFREPPHVEDGRVSFTVELRYADGARLVGEETCQVTVSRCARGFLIVYDSTLVGRDRPLVFGDQEEMGFGFRVATPLTVKSGGEILASDGRRNEAEVRGHAAAWCDYHGMIDGTPAGIMLMPDPANENLAHYHARDYGLLAANPFARRALGLGEAQQTSYSPGDPCRLRFALLLHSGELDREAAYREVLEEVGGR